MYSDKPQDIMDDIMSYATRGELEHVDDLEFFHDDGLRTAQRPPAMAMWR
jgi:hypothetical protein